MDRERCFMDAPEVDVAPTVTESLHRMGVPTNHKNEPQKGVRTNRDMFARAVSALRECESHSNKDIRQLEAENRSLRNENADLREENHAIKAENRLLKAKEKFDELPALTIV